MTGERRELTMRGLELARVACQTVEGLDLPEPPPAHSESSLDPIRLHDTLKLLCEEVDAVGRSSAPATSRLATIVQSLESELAHVVASDGSGAATMGGGATMSTRLDIS